MSGVGHDLTLNVDAEYCPTDLIEEALSHSVTVDAFGAHPLLRCTALLRWCFSGQPTLYASEHLQLLLCKFANTVVKLLYSKRYRGRRRGSHLLESRCQYPVVTWALET